MGKSQYNKRATMESIIILINEFTASEFTNAKNWYEEAFSFKNAEKYDDYFAYMTMSANSGYKPAIKELTNDYYKKLHLKQNHQKMLQFYSVFSIYPHSANYLAYMHKKGFVVQKDLKRAIELYESADIENNTNAMVGLGIILTYEDSEFNDHKRGDELLYKAYKEGNMNANFYCANSYQYGGLTIYPDFTRAMMLHIYNDEINEGNTNAMCEMAKIINQNKDTSHQEAVLRLCKQAGDDGNGYGYSLYALYIQDKNTEEAYDFYIKGIELGDHSSHIWVCELAIKHSEYENVLLDYAINNKNDKLFQMFKTKANLSDGYIASYVEVHELRIKNQQLLEENERLAKENKVLNGENIRLIKENIIIKENNAQLYETLCLFKQKTTTDFASISNLLLK
uniref:Sel1 repeat family protein n=1 Tax=viral metagenome TaxID=1070528 RepID=A0A6C0CBS2_9ZZZZ